MWIHRDISKRFFFVTKNVNVVFFFFNEENIICLTKNGK